MKDVKQISEEQRKDVTNVDVMRELQGDRVVVLKLIGQELQMTHVLTVVRVVDVDRQELRLVNRENKTHKPDWPLSQAMLDHFKPVGHGYEEHKAKWQVTVKPKAS